MKSLLMLLAASWSINASAVEVKEMNFEYTTYLVQAEDVNGIQFYLKKEVERMDCNAITLNANASFAGGNKDGNMPANWHTVYFVTTFTLSTEIGCPPLPEPVKETIKSLPIKLKSFSNRNIDREVIVTLVVPKGYELVVEEY